MKYYYKLYLTGYIYIFYNNFYQDGNAAVNFEFC